MVGGEGHTVPERVGTRGADNAASPVLACLPCAQAVARLGGAPYQKNTIDKALKVAVPKSKPKIVDKNNPWWNFYLSKQRRKLNTLYKHQKANKGYCAKEKYKAFRKEYKKDVEKARKASWDDYKK